VSSESFDVVFYAPWASSLVGGNDRVPPGGTEHQLSMLATGMARRGLKVAMIVVGARSELPGTFDGVRIVGQGRRPGSATATARARLAAGAFRALAGVRAQVLVQMNAGPTTGVAATAARLRSARFVYSSASDGDFEFERWDPRGLNVRMYEWGVRHAWRIVVQNEGQARLCRARFGREPIVIKSVAEQAEPRTSDPQAFLWVGRLQAIKRPLDFLELVRAMPEAKFWMVVVPQDRNPPELLDAVHAAARELPQLELLGPRSRAGIAALIDRAVAVVNTSEREGLPNVFLEAWARGVPALALSFDPDGLVAGRGLGAFAGGDHARFTDQARGLWRDRFDQRALAERCIAYVRDEHDPDRVVDRWIDAIGLSTSGT
jgi:glycosyltransferase involved in cell wall biosynthesis